MSRTVLFAALALTACKKTESTPPTKTVETAAPSTAAVTAPAVTVPATPADMDLTAIVRGDEATVPGASISVLEELEDLATYKESRDIANVVEEKQTADGWLVRHTEDGHVVTTMLRKLGGKPVVCTTTGDTQAEHDAGRATCQALAATGNGIAVPFKLAEHDIDLGAGFVQIKRATVDNPTDGKSLLSSLGWKDGKIVKETKLADGTSVIVEGRMSNNATYATFVRRQIGRLDVVCEGSSLASKLDEAQRIVDSCTAIR